MCVLFLSAAQLVGGCRRHTLPGERSGRVDHRLRRRPAPYVWAKERWERMIR